MMGEQDMREKRERSRGRAGRGMTFAALLCLMGLAVASSPSEQMGRVDAAAPRSPAFARDDSDVVQLTVGDGGFDRAEVTRAVGKFSLTVDDRRSDKSQSLKLRLSDGSGSQLREIDVPERVADWGEELDLQPGQYTLAVVGHDGWVCRITIS